MYSKETFNKLVKLAKKDKNDFSPFNAMYTVCKDSQGDLDTFVEYTTKLKECISNAIAKNSQISEDLKMLFKETLLIEAQNLRFDSYMQYIELEREPAKRFWLPRRKILMPVCEAIQDLIDDKLDLLTISLPPGTGKTTLEVFLHSMLIGHNPDSPSLATGHSEKLTNSIYIGVLDVMSNPEYLWHDVFPDAENTITNAAELTIDINRKHRFSSLTCRAIGGSLTGATRCEQILTADDLVSGYEEAISFERMEKLWALVTDNLRSRRKLGCKELYLATRWSVHDPIGKLRQLYEGSPRAKFIVIPALDENGESNFNYDYGVGFDKKYFEDIRDSKEDEASFKALYMNEPIERKGLLYQAEELRRFYELPEETPDAIISVCDTKDRGEDYCVHIVGYLYGNDWYIDDVICSNALPGQVEGRIVSQMKEHGIQMSRFESNSAGGRIADKIQKEIKLTGGKTKIETKFSSSNKETRIIVNSPWVKENCLFRKDVKFGSDYQKFINMLCSYSMGSRNKHDDVPDAMAMFSDFAQSLSKPKVKSFTRFF